MKLTTQNIDYFIKQALHKNLTALMWVEEDFNTLNDFAVSLGYPLIKDSDSFFGMKHFMVRDYQLK